MFSVIGFMGKCMSRVLLTVCLCTVMYSFAEPPVRLVADRGDCIILEFILPEYTLQERVINGEMYRSVVVPDAVYTSVKGAPRVPQFAQSIVIPDRGAPALEIDAVSFREISVDNIIPSKGVLYRNQNPSTVPYTFGTVYRTDTWYPKEPVSLGRPFILRNFRGVVVYFYPFQYNPVRKILRIAGSIKVKVIKGGGTAINQLYSANKKVPAAFAEIYKQRFVNFNTGRYPELYDGERMLVISAADYTANMAPFIAWKNRVGIRTELYEYPAETGGTGTDALKGFIKQKYDTDSITYILFVGDAADIPTLEGTIFGKSDPSYLKLAGDDHYPDAFLGRFSVEQPAEADRMVNKLLYYEQTPDPDGEWYTKAIGMACDMDGGTGVSDEDWIEDMCVSMESTTYTHIDRIFESESGTVSQVIAALNEGRGWFNYQGHGLQMQFGFPGCFVKNGTFLQLKNKGMLPVILCVACNTGEFDYTYPCIAECATRQDSTGAIAFLGSYIGQPFNPPQVGQKEMVRLLVEDTHLSLGAMVYNGTSKILEAGNSEGQYLETFETWTLFGDPSLLYFSSKPTPMSVTFPQTLDTGTQAVTITFDDVIKGRVCLYSEENGILASKIVSGRDSVTLTASITTEKKIHLTVTARNRMPVMEEIVVGTNAIQKQNTPTGIEKCRLKRVGNALMLYMPFAEEGVVTVSDLKGRQMVTFKTSPGEKWYQLPKLFSSGMYFVTVVMKSGVITRKFASVR